LEHALELDPSDASAENRLAWLYSTAEDAQFRDSKSALRLAQHAVEETNFKNASFLDTLAEAQLLDGRAADALKTERRAVLLDPGNLALEKRLAKFRDAADSQDHQRP
jgi:Flp pilus assembly protein TadD